MEDEMKLRISHVTKWIKWWKYTGRIKAKNELSDRKLRWTMIDRSQIMESTEEEDREHMN